ncbi:MAG TPA: TetR/AcrR family transcriptional regulator, partial [Acidimicrobiales bacterium]|nr:TetR/AcrR family transcriptional regulator [Acidimicrobiales bacterium]
LDRLLDATERCLARYGIRRTSMTDIARELRVARTTLYRQVSSVEEAVSLVASRQFNRFLDELFAMLDSPEGLTPAGFVAAVAGAVRFARSHPVVLRVLRDEPELLGELLSRDLQVYAMQVAEALAPVLASAMASGRIAPGDPSLAAQWVVRVVAALIVLPPEGDLDALLDYALRPMLQGSPG